VRSPYDYWGHPLRHLFSAVIESAVRSFFENGGDDLRLFGLCIPEQLPVREGGFVDSLEPLIHHLRADDDVALLIMPELAYLPCDIQRQTGEVSFAGEALLDRLLIHCREMHNRFLIIDPPGRLHGELLTRWLKNWRLRAPELRTRCAIYYPWLQRGDDLMPPSASMAGLYSRVERKHEPFGVMWPPANVSVEGATHAEVILDWQEANDLVDNSINPIVVQPGRGVVVWGARTLSSDEVWRFVNTRRIVSMVAEQLRRDSQWAVFEQNNPDTWAVLQRDVGLRLEEFWRAGLITGGKERHYLVQCDGSTNPVAERDAGNLHVRVDLQPVGTTEVVTINMRLAEDNT
jgi:phage tail sheath protein FI